MDVRIGCSSWTSPAWTGRFDPTGLKDGDRLAYYARFFNSVEVDSTYYAVPNPFVVRGSARKTPAEFRFALTMLRDLLDPKKPVGPEPIGSFVDTAKELGSKLGAILLQFPPWYKAGSWDHLRRTLDLLPAGPRYAGGLRDASWFRAVALAPVVAELRARSMAWTWSYLTYVDVPPEQTTDFLYLRFTGDH